MVTLPIKNAVSIYEVLFRPLLVTEGLWEQIMVDDVTTKGRGTAAALSQV